MCRVLQLKVFRPFFLSLNLPYSVTRGEQVILHVLVFNYLGQDVNVRSAAGVMTPNQIPLTTIVTYLQNKLQKQNFKPLGHYTCMQCGTSHLQTVQENILSRIILATYRKFTVATVRFTQNVSCNIYTHPRYQQVANVTV